MSNAEQFALCPFIRGDGLRAAMEAQLLEDGRLAAVGGAEQQHTRRFSVLLVVFAPRI